MLMAVVVSLQAVLAAAPGAPSPAPAGRASLQQVVEAMKEARRGPAFRMRLDVSEMASVPAPYADQPGAGPWVSDRFDILVAGARSRVSQQTLPVHQPQAGGEIHFRREKTAVFDGQQYKALQDSTKLGRKTPYIGWSQEASRNEDLITEMCFGELGATPWSRLGDPSATTLSWDEQTGCYKLDYQPEHDMRRTIHVDPGKGYGIRRIETWDRDGNLVMLREIELARQDDRWIPQRQTVSMRQQNELKPYRRITVRSVELNPEVSENTFTLEFPRGTLIWDGRLEDWIQRMDTEAALDDAVGVLLADGSEAKNSKDVPGGAPADDKATPPPAADTPGSAADAPASGPHPPGGQTPLSQGSWSARWSLGLTSAVAALVLVAVGLGWRRNRRALAGG